ncbi:uncharacterized protein LOC111863145 [Cryptotermes secundus]|uniref:uncharacterized protein LOC111863145 n=1 Tax=Cryptotermes secundus TaxID=105785 RepID=UPI000CD7B224|nr:uncharacterized protein LOC111863145 [Cryptotermes secundus]
MVSPCMLTLLAAACSVSAWGEEMYLPPQARHLNTVLQNVITGSEGDDTIIVTGNVEFKETIKVTKKKVNETDHEKMENYFFERCCDVPSNLTYSVNETVRECIDVVQEGISEKGDYKEEATRQLTTLNCILQCVGYKLGLSERNGNILPEEMISFFSSDSRAVVLGITENMINRCIRDAKYSTSEMNNLNEGGKICDTSNTELFKFVKCITELENLHCPSKYLIQSKSCHRRRETMKKKRRHEAEQEIHN